MPAGAVLIVAVAFQIEGTQPNEAADDYWEKSAAQTAGLVSVAETLRADQAPPVYTEGQAVGGVVGDTAQTRIPPVDSGSRVTVATSTGNVTDVLSGGTGSRFESGPQPTYQTAALAALDARDHPGETVAPAPTAGVAYAAQAGESLTEAEMDALLEVTGWPVEWRAEAKAIAFCESKYSPGAVGDGGNSLGLFQLWTGWARPAGYEPDQLYDPVTNSRVALYVRTTRGRWGGGGGWSCSTLAGIE